MERAWSIAPTLRVVNFARTKDNNGGKLFLLTLILPIWKSTCKFLVPALKSLILMWTNFFSTRILIDKKVKAASEGKKYHGHSNNCPIFTQALRHLRQISQEVSQPNVTGWGRRPAALRALGQRLSKYVGMLSLQYSDAQNFPLFSLRTCGSKVSCLFGQGF